MKKILLSTIAIAAILTTVQARVINPDEYKRFAAQAMRVDYDKSSIEIQAKIKEEYAQKIKLSETLVQRYQNDPEFTMIKENVALELWTKKVMGSVKPSEDELKKLYVQVGELKVAPQYKVRHIMLKEESVANDLLTQLKGKTASEKEMLFNEFVQKYSIDMTSKKDQGNIGWIDSGKLSPQAAEQMKSQEKGSVLMMRASQEIWEIIIVDDIKAEHVATFDEAKAFLLNQLQRKKLQDEATKLLKPTPVIKPQVSAAKK